MVTSTLEADPGILKLDPLLTRAVVDGVSKGFGMCDCRLKCVGLSEIPLGEGGLVTGLIGLHGRVSGFATLNMSEKFAVQAVAGLLQDKFTELTPQVVDGVGEITNVIVGSIKGALANTPWAFPNITVPSVIIGRGYQIAYARGLHSLCALFEHQDTETVVPTDRLVQVTLSLMRL